MRGKFRAIEAKVISTIKNHWFISILVSGLIGAILSWGISWILPSRSVKVENLPRKELTCTLDFYYQMITKRVADTELQVFYGDQEVDAPYIYSISIENTGEYSISNEDFKAPFSINFLGSNRIVQARVSKSSNQSLTNEVLTNAKFQGTTLTIEDFFLNVNESFTVYIISDGKPDTIVYSARIADVSEVILKNTPKENRDTKLQNMLYIVAIGVGFSIMTIISMIILDKRAKKKFEEQFLLKYLEKDKDVT